MNEGWIKIHRKLKGSELWHKPASWLKIWLHIIISVSHTETSNLKVGEGLFKYRLIANDCDVSYNQVRRCIDYLTEATSLATRKTTRGIYIKVLNYTKYQVVDFSKATQELRQKPNQSQTEATLYNKNERIKNNTENKNFQKNKNCPRCYEPTTKHSSWCQNAK